MAFRQTLSKFVNRLAAGRWSWNTPSEFSRRALAMRSLADGWVSKTRVGAVKSVSILARTSGGISSDLTATSRGRLSPNRPSRWNSPSSASAFETGRKNPQAPHVLLEHVAAAQAGLVPIGVELHLPEQVARHDVTGHHQPPEDAAAEPDRPLRQEEDQRDAEVDTAAPAPGGQPYVPAVALVDDPREPKTDSADQEAHPHSQALGEMAEFVCQHGGKLLDIHAGREAQADRQHQIVADDHAPKPAAKLGRRVYLAIDVDPPRPQRPDRVADAIHQRKQHGLAVAVSDRRRSILAGRAKIGLTMKAHHGAGKEPTKVQNHGHDAGMAARIERKQPNAVNGVQIRRRRRTGR